MVNAPARQVPAPEWLAHRYDPGHDAIHLVRANRALRRRVPFLTDENLPEATNPTIARRADIGGGLGARRVNFIFHSAYCCSTLLANAYDREGTAFSLKEPVLLNDLYGWRQRGAPPDRLAEVLRDGLDVMARPFAQGEVCVIKPSNVVNGLANDMVAARPEAGVLLLHAPLQIYLGSIASKGLWGRMWVRDLFAKLAADEIVDLGFEPNDYFLQTDLQIAAMGWLAQHALFADIARRWPDRVRTIDSETMLERPIEALTAIDALYGVASSDDDRAAIVGNIFSRHAKFGDAFDASSRTADQRSAAALHSDEISKVCDWATVVAGTAGVAMELPGSLLP